MRHRIVSIRLFVVLFALATPALVFCQEPGVHGNWPQWRGTGWTSHSDSRGLPVEFGPDRNLAWKVDLPGPAGSSPVVWEGNVWLTSVDADDRTLLLLCIGPDGQERWRRQLGGRNRNSRDGANSAAPSPCTDGQHVWATTGAGVLHCFTVDGNEVWSLDLQERFGRFNIQFGMTSSPVLDRGKLYLQLIHGEMRSEEPEPGFVVAIDAATGDVTWSQERKTPAIAENKHSYASPVVYRDDAREFLITHGGDFVIAHALDDGHELWRCGGLNPPDGYNPFLRFVASPAAVPGMIIVPTAKNGVVVSLRPGGSGDITGDPQFVRWTLPRGTPDVASPVIGDGLVWLCRENGLVMCLDAETGEPVWSQRLLADQHRSTPVLAEGRLYITGRDGTVTVLAASREPSVLATNPLGETTTASPAISAGSLYVRTFERLYCFRQANAPSGSNGP